MGKNLLWFLFSCAIATVLIFSCEHPIPAATYDRGPIPKPEVTEEVSKWEKTFDLVSGLYCVIVKIPLTAKEQEIAGLRDDFIYDGFLLLVVEAGSSEELLVDFLNASPITVPENIVGFWYMEDNRWVKRKLPCKFGSENEPKEPSVWYERRI